MSNFQLKNELLSRCESMFESAQLGEGLSFFLGELEFWVFVDGPDASSSLQFLHLYLQKFLVKRLEGEVLASFRPTFIIRYHNLKGELAQIEHPFWSEHLPVYSVTRVGENQWRVLNRDFVAQVDLKKREMRAWGPSLGHHNTVSFDNLLLSCLSDILLSEKSLVLHASAFEVEGQVFCFLGKSGVGKSTLAKSAWEKYGFKVLGGDRVLLTAKNHQLWASGLPISMSEFPYDHCGRTYEAHKVKGLIHLMQKKEWEFSRLTPIQIMMPFVRESLSFQPDRIPAQRHLDLCVEMIGLVELRAEWSYPMGFDFWPPLCEEMNLSLQ